MGGSASKVSGAAAAAARAARAARAAAARAAAARAVAARAAAARKAAADKKAADEKARVEAAAKKAAADKKAAEEEKIRASYQNKADYYLDKAFNSDDFHDRRVVETEPCTENKDDTGYIQTFEFKDKWNDLENSDKIKINNSFDNCECKGQSYWKTGSSNKSFSGCSNSSKNIGDDIRKGKKWCYTKGYCGVGFEEKNSDNKSQDPKISKMWRYCKNKKIYDINNTNSFSCEDYRNSLGNKDDYECMPYKDAVFGGLYQSFKEKNIYHKYNSKPELGDDDFNKNCGGASKPDEIVEGPESCKIMRGKTYAKEYKTQTELGEVKKIDTSLMCNNPKPKKYTRVKKCITPDNKESNSTTLTKPTMNCLTKKGFEAITNDSIRQGSETCTCKCITLYTENGQVKEKLHAGHQATGEACFIDDGNICKSCPSEMKLDANTKLCVCKDGYEWDNEKKKCVKNCKFTNWRLEKTCKNTTGIYKNSDCDTVYIRTITQRPNLDGKKCTSNYTSTKKNQDGHYGTLTDVYLSGGKYYQKITFPCSRNCVATYGNIIGGKKYSNSNLVSDRCSNTYERNTPIFEGCNNGNKDNSTCPLYQNEQINHDCKGRWDSKSRINDAHCHLWKAWCRDYNWKKYSISVEKCGNGKACPSKNGDTKGGGVAGHYYASSSCSRHKSC